MIGKSKLVVVAMLVVIFVLGGIICQQTRRANRLQTRLGNAALEYQLWLDNRDRREIEYWRKRAQRYQLESEKLRHEKEAWEFCDCERCLNRDCAVRFSQMEVPIPYKEYRGGITLGHGGSNSRSYFVVWHVGQYLPTHWLDGRGASSRAPRDARDIVCADPKQAVKWVGIP